MHLRCICDVFPFVVFSMISDTACLQVKEGGRGLKHNVNKSDMLCCDNLIDIINVNRKRVLKPLTGNIRKMLVRLTAGSQTVLEASFCHAAWVEISLTQDCGLNSCLEQATCGKAGT